MDSRDNMVALLLLISFILHIITLFSLYMLFQQYKKGNALESKEIIELMETYLEEIKEENNRLQNYIHSLEREKDNAPAKTAAKSELPAEGNKEEESFALSLAEKMNDHIEASLEAKVLQLHQQGKSLEEIAKTLNCGKTEAELIIKFQQKM